MEGDYALTVSGSGVNDLAGNAGTGSASDMWVEDMTPPMVTDVVDVDPDPRNAPVSAIAVTFSEPIDLATFSAADLTLTRDGAPVLLSGLSVSAFGGSSYRVSGLDSVTTVEGDYVFVIHAEGIADSVGNAGVGADSTEWMMDTTSPTVTINQASDQGDPTNSAQIRFDVAFSEPVIGFDGSRVSLSGTVGGTLSASAVPGLDPNTYVVTVTGMTSSGTVNASIATDAVTDTAGNGNTASTSTDNLVTFDNLPPSVAIHPAANQADPTGGTSIAFDVLFSEPVLGFSSNSINLSDSTAQGSLLATVSGTGPAYTVTVTGMTSGGMVVAFVGAGVVNDLAGNGNTASNSASVAYVRSGVLEFSSATYDVDETGSPILTVTVRRTNGSEGPLSVHYSTGGGTALPNTNYVLASGTLSWLAGDSADKSFMVQIVDDGQTLGNSTVGIALGDASFDGTLGTPANATVTIHEASILEFAQSSYHVSEAGGTAIVTVHRLFGDRGPVTVNYATTNGSATAGSDYIAAAGTLTWNDGDASDKSFPISIVDDSLCEGNETIHLALSSPSGNAKLSGDNATDLVIDKSDGRAAGPTPFTDSDGDMVTIKLNGKVGTLTYYLTNGTGPIAEIDLDSTSSTKSSVAITVKKPRHGAGDGRISIDEVDGSGLKSFTAKSSDLVDAGFHLTGFLGSLRIGDVRNGADLDLAGTGPTTKSSTRIVTGVINDGTDIAIAAPLAYLRSVAIGTGTIAAPSVGSIVVKGRKATKLSSAVAGNFESDLTVAGTGLASTKLAALKSLTVAGTVRGATLHIGGSTGTAWNDQFHPGRLVRG